VNGLPLFLFPDALYYNSKLAQELPLSLAEMLLMPPRLEDGE
jgi:hypothetical protein